jgi:arabinogalactan oligomer / maltooligosaccharide transport system permease protein
MNKITVLTDKTITKKRINAGLLGIFFGLFGAHKFYLKRKKSALYHLVFFWTLIPGIIGFIEGVLYLTSNNRDFENDYRGNIINTNRGHQLISNTFIHLFLVILSIIWLIPIVWLLLQSFRAEPGAVVPYFFPKTYTFNNYLNMFTLDNPSIRFPLWFLNTLIVAVATCLISSILILLTSYAFSRMRFKARMPMMRVILILGLFPGFLSMIAIYHILKLIGLTGNIGGLILVYSGGAAMGYYITKGFFDTIPKSIDEAAMIDGANKAQIFWKIILPLSKPIIIFTALTTFIGPWVDFIFAQYILGPDNVDQYTVAPGLFWLATRELQQVYFTSFAAGAVLVAIPITILFIILQRYYVTGVTGGSVKG